jgi:hypothetical protein
VQSDDVAPSGHGRLDDQLADTEPSDGQVDVGQEGARRLGRGRLERRFAQEADGRGGELADVDLAAQVGEGPPVEGQGRGGQEHALGIADLQAADRHAPVERAVDAADAHAQP